MAAQEGGGLPGRTKSKGAVPAFEGREQKAVQVTQRLPGRPVNRLGIHVHWNPR